MKTLRITLFFIFGTLITLHSFAQEQNIDKKAKIKMVVLDEDGNKKEIDTTFIIEPNQDIEEIIRQFKKNAGFSEEEIAKMKSEMKAHAKEMTVDVELLMNDNDIDSLRDHMFFVRKEMFNGKADLEKALEELKVELESMKMNEKAMQKLEKAMRELQKVDWEEHSLNLEAEMNELHEHLADEIKVFITDGDQIEKNVWVDDDGEKHIIVNMTIDDDSLNINEDDNIFIMGDDLDKNKNVWVEKNGDKVIIKKKNGGNNMVFFGDDTDLEEVHEMDGEHRFIVKKIKGEAAKGDAIFISDDAHVIKEFKDEDGNVKVMRYTVKVDDDADGEVLKEEYEKRIMIVSAEEDILSKAEEKGILNANAEVLKLDNFTLDIDNDKTSIGTTFNEKGKLKVKLFDGDMNQLWEENFGKVSGEWSTEIPSELLKDAGKYFLMFNHAKKVKLMILAIE